MTTPQTVLGYVKAEPFRPFRLPMATGKVLDLRRPETIRVGESNALFFSFVSEQPEVFDEWQSVSLMLIESISHLEVPAA